jgi:hypothetical protein
LSLNKNEDKFYQTKRFICTIITYLPLISSPRNEQAMMAEDRKEITIKQAHSILGHVNRLQTLFIENKYE